MDYRYKSNRGQDYTRWFDELFPVIPEPHHAAAKPDEDKWPAAARELADMLLRRDKLLAMEGGLEINRTTQSFDVRYDELSSQSRERELVSPQAWLVRSGGNTSLEHLRRALGAV